METQLNAFIYFCTVNFVGASKFIQRFHNPIWCSSLDNWFAERKRFSWIFNIHASIRWWKFLPVKSIAIDLTMCTVYVQESSIICYFIVRAVNKVFRTICFTYIFHDSFFFCSSLYIKIHTRTAPCSTFLVVVFFASRKRPSARHVGVMWRIMDWKLAVRNTHSHKVTRNIAVSIEKRLNNAYKLQQ